MEKELTARESSEQFWYKQAADKIFNLLEVNRNHASLSSKRWAWELIQNAKDVPNKYGKVSIEIERVSERELLFKHNGNPFDLEKTYGR